MAKNYEILLVDDEPDILSLLEDILERRKYIVHSANSISKALKVLEENKDISLVISDIKMPEGTGIELLKTLRANNPIKPIVLFLTAFTDISIEDVYNRGASGFIEKPIDIKAFIKTIEETLEEVHHDTKDKIEEIPCKEDVCIKLTSLEGAKIGTGGVFIPLDEINVRPKELVRFQINFSNGQPQISGIGEVAWIRRGDTKGPQPQGIGLKFVNLEEASERIIHNWVRQQGIIAFIPNN